MKKKNPNHRPEPIARVLYTAGIELPKDDQLRIAAAYRFDREWSAAGESTTELARRWGVTPRQARRIYVLFRGPQR